MQPATEQLLSDFFNYLKSIDAIHASAVFKPCSYASGFMEKMSLKNDKEIMDKLTEKLWDLHSTGIPEDAYGGAEEIADMVSGKSILYEKDFFEAVSELQRVLIERLKLNYDNSANPYTKRGIKIAMKEVTGLL